MHPVAVDGGPELPFPVLGAPHQPCLQAAAFSEPATGDARGNALTPVSYTHLTLPTIYSV